MSVISLKHSVVHFQSIAMIVLKKCFQNMFVKNTLKYGLDSLCYHMVSFDML